MDSRWRLFCTIVIGLEGILGLALSLFLLYIIVIKKRGTTVAAYRCCIAINAAQGAFNCVLLISGLWTHVLSDGFFISIVYGPVKYTPKWLRRVITFITAPCIVQYLVLFRNTMSNTRRVGIAYLFTAFSMAISAPYFWLLVPYPEIEGHLREIAKRIQHLNDYDDFVVYGIGLQEDPANGNRTAFGLAFYGIAPSYFLTYPAFGFTVMKIVHELSRVNTGMSVKTIELQKRFIRIQLIQGFIPLTILTIPFVTFISFIITGANLDNWTLMLTFSLWSLPAVQATVYLIFLVRSIRAEIKNHVLFLDVTPSSQLSHSSDANSRRTSDQLSIMHR